MNCRYDESVIHSISLSKAIEYVSKVTHTTRVDSSDWVVSYAQNGVVPEVKVKGVGSIIHNSNSTNLPVHLKQHIITYPKLPSQTLLDSYIFRFTLSKFDKDLE